MVRVKPWKKNGTEGWEVDIRITLPGGTRHRERVKSPVSSKSGTIRWAQQREAVLLAQVPRKESEETAKDKAGTLTLGAYLDTWLGDRELRGVASLRDDRARLRLHVTPTLGELLLANLRPHHVRDLLRDLRAKPSPKGGTLAPRTIRHVYFLLRQACHEAVVDELIAANPVQVKKSDLPGKEDKDPTWRAEADFTRKEVETLISDKRIPENRRVAYALEFLTGMRTGEVSARRWRDLDPVVKPLTRMVALTAYNSRLRIEKSTKTRVAKWIPIHPTLAKVLAAWKLTGYERIFGHKPRPDDLIMTNVRAASATTGGR